MELRVDMTQGKTGRKNVSWKAEAITRQHRIAELEAEIERLRTEAGANRLLFEAAQKELELQVAEVERLRAANDVLKGDIHELSQREERLRVVLGHLVAVDDADWSGMDRGWTDVVNEARAALAKEEA